jgi:cyclopropane fatty-acyl-phospholipid synthase-like methyltransferase
MGDTSSIYKYELWGPRHGHISQQEQDQRGEINAWLLTRYPVLKVLLPCMTYRDIPSATYNKITYLEMAEHVGVRHFSSYPSSLYQNSTTMGYPLSSFLGCERARSMRISCGPVHEPTYLHWRRCFYALWVLHLCCRECNLKSRV